MPRKTSPTGNARLDRLIRRVIDLQNAGVIPAHLTAAERISWVYGNLKLSNPDITMADVKKAVWGPR